MRQRFLSQGLVCAFLAIAGLPALAQEPVAISPEATHSPNMSFNFSAPFISSSALRGDHHIIRVTVVGMSLNDLDVSIPKQMASFDQVRILDESGRAIPAKIDTSQSQVKVQFDQPVQPGRTVALDISGVNTQSERGSILLYGIMGRRGEIRDSIPIGTARIQVPDFLDR